MKIILLFLATVVSLQGANEFWVTPDNYVPAMSQGQSYDPRLSWPVGTVNNPYNGSDANRFDSVMNSLPTNCLAHLLAGKYQTAGGWMPRAGQRILGAGMYQTTIQFPDYLVKSWSGLGGTRHMVQPSAPYGIGGTTLEDFTLDANYQKGAIVTLCGAQILGPNCTMRHVRLINCGSYTTNITNYAECFGLTIGSRNSYENSGGDEFDGCVVSDYTQNFNNNMSPICFSDLAHGRVINCDLNNNLYDGTNSMLGIGIAADNTLVMGNTTRWNRDALHFDTGTSWTNAQIIGNNFLFCAWAQDFHNATFSGINYIGNTVILTNFAPKNPWCAFINMQNDAVISGIHSSGNRISIAPCTKPCPAYFAVMQNVSGFQSDGDFIDAGCSNQIVNSTGVTIQSRDLKGNPYPGNTP
jgi:hypothetical protein